MLFPGTIVEHQYFEKQIPYKLFFPQKSQFDLTGAWQARASARGTVAVDVPLKRGGIQCTISDNRFVPALNKNASIVPRSEQATTYTTVVLLNSVGWLPAFLPCQLNWLNSASHYIHCSFPCFIAFWSMSWLSLAVV